MIARRHREPGQHVCERDQARVVSWQSKRSERRTAGCGQGQGGPQQEALATPFRVSVKGGYRVYDKGLLILPDLRKDRKSQDFLARQFGLGQVTRFVLQILEGGLQV